MGRKQKKCAKKCEKHLLHLRPFHSMAYLSRDVQVSFCPTSLQKKTNYPSFNKDRKHYTPAFCLEDDQPKYRTNDSYYKTQHDKFCEQQEKGKSQMLIPKPRSKNQYCYVCKTHYFDYHEHVKSNGHKLAIRKNKFSDHIDDLIEERYPRKIMRPIFPISTTKIDEQTEQIPQELISCSSFKSVGSIGHNTSQIKFTSSFVPFNRKESVEVRQVTRKQVFKGFSLADLGQNRVPITPDDINKNIFGTQEQKKTPNSTKLHVPIILNSPLALL